ncbi:MULTISPECIES: hypothetical protein [Pyrobaculum]|uniref:Uncharacterized protein n=2 Tax=Pyrobaculum arsenaticum TaxID=121277 RepID=A4WHR7_PYRAR|nr:hypothetical protein [Pyrobaculum arsenaticum]ABP49934.1 hypothetical protein Pars_0322 [Pyrobaculum arsenaticum DSM 13514]MCY0891556.1 hypothetical protein [Pyrobaculum arsenaticum]NYR15921.1 hypothetical protein [Pyrobaculum arsenaticum]
MRTKAGAPPQVRGVSYQDAHACPGRDARLDSNGGEMPPEEAGAYAGSALAKMGVFLATRGSVDVLKALREERGWGQWGGRGGDYL